MATGPQAFYCLWQEERIRETFFELLPNEDICSVRLASSACCNLVTKRLFKRTHLTFTANTFTKASRVQALSRIGHHIEHLTFYIAHSDATFLPPLIHPLTGREINFLYTPHTCMASVLTRPKYANTELGGILTQQYPPLFHAATNVPSFLNAMKHMTNIRHLTIKCPGQDPKERYRRSIVDYALISLRISIERSPLHKLSKLSLSRVHPAAFNYLRHVPAFGSHPSAARRWRQIRKLYMSVDTWDFYGPSPGLDHLKIIDDYVRNMTPHLEKLSFTWLDDHNSNGNGIVWKGPCPVALSGDVLFSPACDGGSKKLFNEITGPMSPLPPAPRREPMQFARLRSLRLCNCTVNTPQLRDLVERHKNMVREFAFENVSLTDGGSYEEAFSELLNQVSDRGSNLWSRSGLPTGSQHPAGNEGGWDSSSPRQHNDSEPNVLSPEEFSHPHPSHPSHLSFRLATGPYSGSFMDGSPIVRCGPAAVAAPDDVQLPSPSAAVAAVSRDLLDIDSDDLGSHLGMTTELPFADDWQSDVLRAEDQSTQVFVRKPPPPPINEEDEDGQEEEDEIEWKEKEEYRQEEQEWTHVVPEQVKDELASDVSAAQEASLTFTTRLKKTHDHSHHRKHHHHHHHHHPDDRRGREREVDDRNTCRSGSRRRHHQHHHQQEHSQHRHRSASRSRSRSRVSHGRRRHRHHRSRSRRNPSSAASSQSVATPQTPPPPVPPLVARDYTTARCASPVVTAPVQQSPSSWLAAIGIVGDHRRVYSLGRSSGNKATSSKSNSSRNNIQEGLSRLQTTPEAQSPRVASATVAPLNISAPLPNRDPLTVLLQPVVYNPGATSSPPASLARKNSNSSSCSVLPSSPPVRPPPPLLVRRPSAAEGDGDGLSSTQRQILEDHQQQQQQQKDAEAAAAEQRAAQQRRRLMMAEDVDARTWALKKAKEAVLAKLSREFQQRMNHEATQRSAAASATTAAVAAAAVSGPLGPPLPHGWMGLGCSSTSRSGNHSTSHVLSASTALSLLTGGGGGSGGVGGGLRLRDRLFGEPLPLPHGSGGGPGGGSSYPYGVADMPLVSPSVAAVAALDHRYQHHSMESNQSAVVPLIFSLA